MAPKDLEGKWQMHRSENFEDFLKEMGANWMVRKVASQFSPTVEILVDGDRIFLKTTTMAFTQEDEFVIGETVEKTMPQAAVVMKMTPKWDGDVLEVQMVPKEEGKGKPHTIRREVTVHKEMITTIIVGDVVCKRFFKPAESM